jgi:hypothetical protein
MASNAYRLLFAYDTHDTPNKEQAEDRFSKSDDVWAIGADSRASLMRHLDWCVNQRMTFERGLFQTHGAPGNLIFGTEMLDSYHLTTADTENFSRKNYHLLFPERAVVYFDGCNVGANESGTDFLVNFGTVFLRNKGGITMAFTNPGYGMEGWVPIFGGHTLHFFGTLKEIYFTAGGLVVPEPVIPDPQGKPNVGMKI